MAHENFARVESPRGSSNRSFGIVAASAFALGGLWPVASGDGLRAWPLAVAVLLFAAALGRPGLLALPNRAWTRLGLVLGRVAAPLAIACLFYAVITPFGLLMRLFRRDPLRLARAPEADTYWVERTPPGPDPADMKDAF